MKFRVGEMKDKKDIKEPFLIVLEGIYKGMEYPIKGEVTIGRTSDNSIVLQDRGVSRKHAIIREEGGVYTLEDLGSSNGTRLNGRRITMVEVLRDGDRIGIGEAVLLFMWPEGKVTEGETTIPGIHPKEEESGKKKLILSTRLKVVTVAFISFIVICCLLYFLKKGKGEEGVDYSEYPVEYSDTDTFFNMIFGYGNNDKTHPDKVIINFEYIKGRVTLHYSAWQTDKAKEVEIKLNGHHIGYAPLTTTYRYDIQVELPRNLLNPSQKNVLVFDNTLNPPAKDNWEIAHIKIEQSPLLSPDPEKARSEFQIAMRLYNDRNVDPANLYEAQKHFMMVRDLLEMEEPKSQIYYDAISMIDKIGIELQKIFDDGIFSAERAYRYGDTEKAKYYLRQTLKYFPSIKDIRNRQLRNYLENLEESFSN